MSVTSITPAVSLASQRDLSSSLKEERNVTAKGAAGDNARELFQQGVGETFYRQMLKSLRASTGKPAYFCGGHAEKVYQGQLDEIIIEKMAEASGNTFATEAMFELQFPQLATRRIVELDGVPALAPQDQGEMNAVGSANATGVAEASSGGPESQGESPVRGKSDEAESGLRPWAATVSGMPAAGRLLDVGV